MEEQEQLERAKALQQTNLLSLVNAEPTLSSPVAPRLLKPRQLSQVRLAGRPVPNRLLIPR